MTHQTKATTTSDDTPVTPVPTSKPRRRIGKRIALILALLVVGGLGYVAYDSYVHQFDPACPKSRYSITFWLNADELKKRGLDYLSMPDVFMTVDVEGEGTFLIPEKFDGYEGSKRCWSFEGPSLQEGAKVIVNFWDDDATSNTIWANILKARVQVEGSIGAVWAPVPTVQVHGNASGKAEFQIIKDGDKITLDASDFICSAEFDARPGKFQQTYTLFDPTTHIKHGEVTLRISTRKSP